MSKKLMTVVAVVLLVSLVVPVYADQHKKGRGCSCGKSKEQMDLGEKILYKAHFFLKNEEELALMDEQIRNIKDLKLGVKKELIQREAAIELAALDIKAMMYEDVINLEQLNLLIDKKYELKKAKAKYLAERYVALKSILTAEQMEAAKGLWKTCDKK